MRKRVCLGFSEEMLCLEEEKEGEGEGNTRLLKPYFSHPITCPLKSSLHLPHPVFLSFPT